MSLEIQNISKRFGTLAAVHEASLQVGVSEFVSIVGPSGCGKTTLLRLVAGLERQDAGTIRVGGRSVSDLQPRDRDIAMVFQGESLYPHLPVQDNLAFPLAMRNVAQTEIAPRVERIAEQLSIADLLERYPETLSGGQRQRVAIGRALIREPSVCLLDEPFSHLDAHIRRRLGQEVSDLRKSWSAATLFVTHDIREAMKLGDRVVVMCEGKIHQVDTPEQIRATPATPFVAEFIDES